MIIASLTFYGIILFSFSCNTGDNIRTYKLAKSDILKHCSWKIKTSAEWTATFHIITTAYVLYLSSTKIGQQSFAIVFDAVVLQGDIVETSH